MPPFYFFLLKRFNFIIYIWVCVCIWKCTCWLLRTEEGIRCLEDEVTGVCETLDEGTWKGTPVLWRSNKWFLLLSHLSRPDLFILNAALPSTMPQHFQTDKFMYLSYLCFFFSWTSYWNRKSWWAEVVRFNLLSNSTYFFTYKCYFQPFYSFLWSLSQLFLKSRPLQIASMIIC